MSGAALSRFRDRPTTKAGWWSMGLGSSAVLVLMASSVLPGADVRWGELNVVPSVVLVVGLSALAPGVVAYRAGERSFVLWVGLVLGVLFGLLMIAEIAFME